MEEQLPDTASAEVWSESFARTLDTYHQRAEEFLSGQREQFDRLETKLVEQIEQTATKQDGELADADRRRSELNKEADELQQQTSHLQQVADQLARREQQWEQLQSESGQERQALLDDVREQTESLEQNETQLLERRQQCDQRDKELEERPNTLFAAQDKLNEERSDYAAQLAAHEQARSQLHEQRESFAAERAELGE